MDEIKTNAAQEPAEDQEESLILKFRKPYMFEGKEYTEVDLSAMEDMTAEDLCAMGKIMTKLGIVNPVAEMTVDYLATATLVMTVGCLGWIIFTILFADKMDRVNSFMAGGNNALIPVISAGCIMGCYSNLVVEQVFPFGPEAAAGIAGAISMPVFIILSKKLDKPWLNDWALTFAMLIGVMASIPFL